MKTIQYGIDKNTGLVWSRVGSTVAIPILDYEDMTSHNNFQTISYLEKFNIIDVCTELQFIKWTKKIDISMKNIHRHFWGFKPLRDYDN